MKPTWTTIGLSTLALCALAPLGCGGTNGANPSASAPAGAASPGKSVSEPSTPAAALVAQRPESLNAVKPTAEAGMIVGWVGLDGPPPKRRPINFGAEKVCADLNRDHTPMDEALVLNPNGTVKWTLVSIKNKMPGDHPAPSEPAVLDQVGCVFVPHVVALRVGQEIEYRNSDPVSHNIRATPKKNTSYNNIFSSKMNAKSKFDAPEIGIPLKCDIHFWMSSYVHVMPHPYYAVTGDDGSFVIAGVPPGSYTLQTWHESLKPQTREVNVKAGEVLEVPFQLASGK